MFTVLRPGLGENFNFTSVGSESPKLFLWVLVFFVLKYSWIAFISPEFKARSLCVLNSFNFLSLIFRSSSITAGLCIPFTTGIGRSTPFWFIPIFSVYYYHRSMSVFARSPPAILSASSFVILPFTRYCLENILPYCGFRISSDAFFRGSSHIISHTRLKAHFYEPGKILCKRFIGKYLYHRVCKQFFTENLYLFYGNICIDGINFKYPDIFNINVQVSTILFLVLSPSASFIPFLKLTSIRWPLFNPVDDPGSAHQTRYITRS